MKTNFAKARSLKDMQHTWPRNQHVQKTSNVTVSMKLNVMVKFFGQKKALALSLPPLALVHGLKKVSVDLLFQKEAQILKNVIQYIIMFCVYVIF